jgi:hypothetical protein
VKEEKTIRRETFESKIRILDEKITQNAENFDQKFQLLKDQLVSLEDSVL